MELTPHEEKVVSLWQRACMGLLDTTDGAYLVPYLVEFYRLATEKPKVVGIPQPPAEPNIDFEDWVETMPANSWAHYDLSACRLGWEAGVSAELRALREYNADIADDRAAVITQRDEARRDVEALQRALNRWLPHIVGDGSERDDCAQRDAVLLFGLAEDLEIGAEYEYGEQMRTRIEKLEEVLQGVIRAADRDTVEFEAARAALKGTP